jgi:hypothetical protein
MHPPDMPTTALVRCEDECVLSSPTALNHHGGPVAAATPSSRATPAPIIVSRETAIKGKYGGNRRGSEGP